MPEREGGVARVRGGALHGEKPRAAEAELLLERSAGEPLLDPQPQPESVSLLRPQQGRNVVWRWHVRRRPRAH